jgi:O-succinylbenzoic acid--CoA ligase
MSTFSILDAAREAGRKLAVVEGTREITFAELAERVRECTRLLGEALGSSEPRRERLVALHAEEDLGTLELIYALLELGQPFLPLHSRLTDAESERLVRRLPVSGILRADVQGGLHFQPRPGLSGDARQRQLLRTTPQLAAIATSGSTGEPSVVALSRQAFLASATASAANLRWLPSDRWLLCLPLAHIGGLSVVTRCLLARRAVVLPERSLAGELGERLARAIQSGLPTLLSVVPTQLSALLALSPAFCMPPRVRAILTGGAASSQPLLAAALERGWPVLTSYGLSEACSQVATQLPGTMQRGELGVGRPLPGVEIRLVDGVIHLRGPNLMTGYLAGPSEPFSADGWFRTRDLGRLDEEGNLHVLGRADHTIISGGENIEPAEVEAFLESCPGVLEACVFPVTDPHWGQVVAAGLRLQDGSETSEEVLSRTQSAAAQKLAAFKRPRAYAVVERFVHNRNGKLDRKATAAALASALRPAPRLSSPSTAKAHPSKPRESG